jgi:hypothetical protein
MICNTVCSVYYDYDDASTDSECEKSNCTKTSDDDINEDDDDDEEDFGSSMFPYPNLYGPIILIMCLAEIVVEPAAATATRITMTMKRALGAL